MHTVANYGWSESEALLMNESDRIPSNQHLDELNALRNLAKAERLEPFRTQRLVKNGSLVDVWITATALLNEDGQIYAIATTERAADNTSEK